MHGGRGIAEQDIVGRGNVQTLDLDLRPMRDFLLETDAAMPDQRNIERILLLHDGIAGTRVGLGQQKPPQRALSCREKYSYFSVSADSDRAAKSGLPWSDRSVTSVASLL